MSTTKTPAPKKIAEKRDGDWGVVEESSDESFPASDPPGWIYRDAEEKPEADRAAVGSRPRPRDYRRRSSREKSAREEGRA